MRSFHALVLMALLAAPPPRFLYWVWESAFSIHALEIAFLDHPKHSRRNAFDLVEMRVVCRDKNKQKNTCINRHGGVLATARYATSISTILTHFSTTDFLLVGSELYWKKLFFYNCDP
jgi:hypothetical protein